MSRKVDMRTSEIAKLVNVHPNTVRLYEQWGYISPVPRSSNGYRNYDLIHAVQMKLARIVFRQEFVQNNLRKMATAIVLKSGRQRFEEALLKAQQYLSFLQSELDFANQAVNIVKTLLHEPVPNEQITYYHKEVANKLMLTEETIRNWERNGLYEVRRTNQNRRIYDESDIHKLFIIRTLRTAHFSISSIRHFLVHAQQVHSVEDIKKALISPAFLEKFLHVTDALEINLNKAIADARTAIALLESYISGDLSLLSISKIN